MNEGAEAWRDAYGGQAMSILNSIQVGVGLMTEREAIEMAEEVCTVDYTMVRPSFDGSTGEWKVWFYKGGNTVGGDQTVWISPDGEIKSEYGE